MPSGPNEAKDFNDVFEAELNLIEQVRCVKRNYDWKGPRPETNGKEKAERAKDLRERAHEEQLVGLALSGGGIRSATFNLGVLQGLARFRLLEKFDYLSTVSGGGYIGNWLVAWSCRRAAKRLRAWEGKKSEGKLDEKDCRKHECELRESLEDVRRGLTPERYDDPGGKKGEEQEPKEIEFLREHSNYLTPQRGLLSPDSLTVASTYIRNVFLNLLILTPALVGIMLIPRLNIFFYQWAELGGFPGALDVVLPGLVLILLIYAAVVMVKNLDSLFREEEEKRDRGGVLRGRTSKEEGAKGQRKGRKERRDGPVGVRLKVVLPVLTSAWILSFWLWRVAKHDVGVLFWLLILVSGWLANVLVWALGWWIADALKGEEGWQPRRGRRESKQMASSGFFDRSSQFLREKGERIHAAAPWESFLSVVHWAGVAGAFGGLLFVGLVVWFENWESDQKHLYIGSFGMPLVALVYMLTASLHIGLVGRDFSGEAREWWSRLGASVGRWTLLIGGAWVLAVGAPRLVDGLVALLGRSGELVERLLGQEVGLPLTELSGWSGLALVVLWLVASATGILAGRESLFRIMVAPVVFVAGLLLGLAYVAEQVHEGWVKGVLLDKLGSRLSPWATATGRWIDGVLSALPETAQEAATKAWELVPPIPSIAEALLVGFCAVILILLALFLSKRIGINEFSMHAFYRNRLVRSYLGASNEQRNAHPFTGFDPDDDDITVWQLQYDKWEKEKATTEYRPYVGLYPILNAALNLSSGKRLAWQERRAASFVFTPLYCGYEYVPEQGLSQEELRRELEEKELGKSGYREAEDYGGGLSLGTAMAISGAAATPAMGHFTKGPLAFLMTVFNVRLGWWLGNPRTEKKNDRGEDYYWRSPGPSFGLKYLIKELMGSTDDEGEYVYLSDGGHFENLGVYELVRRRCHFIVACDAGQDRDMKFGDLAGAIQKCRTDFGVDIEIDVEPLRRKEGGRYSTWHCAVGKIRYDQVDKKASVGTLLYLKTSLTGDEPTDVLRYADEKKEFPHQSTADQFFNETQFESYRSLGQHIIQAVLENVAEREEISPLGTEREEKRSLLTTEALLVRLRHRWYPPSTGAASFTRHTAGVDRLFAELQHSKELRGLHEQLFPEWPALKQHLLERAAGRRSPPRSARTVPEPEWWLPDDEGTMRQGFYLCNRMIQLMEDVYIDLNLEEEYGHPDNRGWMNFFKRWCWSGLFRTTYALSAGMYGARFQTFCERRLHLKVGEVEVGRPEKLGRSPRAKLQELRRQHLLNPLEAELIEKHVKANNSKWKNDQRLSGKGRVVTEVRPLLLQVQNPVPKQGAFHYSIGFVLYSYAQQQGRWFPLVIVRYFRVQDQLRKMGLARDAMAAGVKELCSKLKGGRSKAEAGQATERFEIEVDFRAIPFDALEKPTEEDTKTCQLVFNSVLQEFKQRENIAGR